MAQVVASVQLPIDFVLLHTTRRQVCVVPSEQTWNFGTLPCNRVWAGRGCDEYARGERKYPTSKGRGLFLLVRVSRSQR